MPLVRRDFIKICASTVAGYGISRLFHPSLYQALAETLTGERPPIIWLQGQSCTGCLISVLNSMHPAIADILLQTVRLDYQPTIMAGEGEQAVNYLRETVRKNSGKFFLVVEGSIPVDEDGRYCIIGEAGHKEITIADMLEEIAPQAAVTIALGTCAAYGGIPAAQGGVTGAQSIMDFFSAKKITVPVINIPGCPPHPDWFIGTLLLTLDAIKRKGQAEGLADMLEQLDGEGRPLPYFGANTHDNCPYLSYFEEEAFTPTFNQKNGCRYNLGCKGPDSMCDSPTRRWNGRVSWCVENAVCIGCVQPDFPDGQSPFYEN